MSELQIVGGGRMGEAFLAGLINAGLSPGAVAVVETDKARRAQLADAYGVVTSAVVTRAPDAIVAVKPGLVAEVCTSLAAAGVRRVVSVAAGVRIVALEAALGPDVVVVRAMPNTPALVGRGAAALAGGTRAAEVDIEWAQSLLSSVGVAVVVSEPALDAVTGLSGSGPAYVFMFAEALVDAGVLNGLPRPLAETLALNTIAGAGEMLLGQREPAQLRADVTSPGGTTAAGLQALEAGGMRAALLDAVTRATERSRELGSN